MYVCMLALKACMYVCIYACMYVFRYACMYVYMYKCIITYIGISDVTKFLHANYSYTYYCIIIMLLCIYLEFKLHACTKPKIS